MNRRTYRLFAPGLAFGIVGVLVLWAGADDDYELRGGPVVSGVYGIAMQVVLSLLLLASIDDFGDRSRARRMTPVAHGLVDHYNERAQSYGFAHALARFYLDLFAPMALLAFGVGATLSAIVDGALSSREFSGWSLHPSEFAMGSILLVGAAFLLVKGTLGSFCGWCIGFAMATALGQGSFVEGTDDATVPAWGLFAAALCATRVLWWIVTGIVRHLIQWMKVEPAHG